MLNNIFVWMSFCIKTKYCSIHKIFHEENAELTASEYDPFRKYASRRVGRYQDQSFFCFPKTQGHFFVDKGKWNQKEKNRDTNKRGYFDYILYSSY